MFSLIVTAKKSANRLISSKNHTQYNVDKRKKRTTSKIYYYNGVLDNITYCIDGKHQYHRTNGPAVIYFFSTGNVRFEIWFLNGKKHRIDGPSFIRYRENGMIHFKEWHYLGNRHRLNQLAYILYSPTGDITRIEMYNNGIPVIS